MNSVIVTLGRGRFSICKLVQALRSDGSVSFYCLKCSDDTGRLEKECLIMSVLNQDFHPHIIQSFGQMNIDHYSGLALELCAGGSLSHHLKHSSISVHQARIYTSEIFSALQHLERCRCIHRDIKASNILLDAHGHARLADFGCAKVFPSEMDLVIDSKEERNGRYLRTYTIVGTPHIMAPEVVALSATSEKTGYSAYVDYWSLGIVLCEMLTGHAPGFLDADVVSSARAHAAFELINKQNHLIHQHHGHSAIEQESQDIYWRFDSPSVDRFYIDHFPRPRFASYHHKQGSFSSLSLERISSLIHAEEEELLHAGYQCLRMLLTVHPDTRRQNVQTLQKAAVTTSDRNFSCFLLQSIPLNEIHLDRRLGSFDVLESLQNRSSNRSDGTPSKGESITSNTNNTYHEGDATDINMFADF